MTLIDAVAGDRVGSVADSCRSPRPPCWSRRWRSAAPAWLRPRLLPRRRRVRRRRSRHHGDTDVDVEADRIRRHASAPRRRPARLLRRRRGRSALAPQAVPPATGNNAVITVKVGGNRLTTAAVGGLAGVTLTLYDGNATAPDDPCHRASARTPACPTSTATAVGSSPNTQSRRCQPQPAVLGRADRRPRRLAAELLADHRPGRRPVRRHAVPVPDRDCARGRDHLQLRRLVHARHRQHRRHRVRWDLAEHQGQSGRPDEVRSQRRPDPRRVGLGEPVRCPPSRPPPPRSPTRWSARRPSWRCSPSPRPRRRPAPTTRTGR